jgi:hypothetical protein
MRYLFKIAFIHATLLFTLASSADIEKSDFDFNSALSSFRVRMFGYSDSMLYVSSVAGGQNDIVRHWSNGDMGIAFYPPPHAAHATADSVEMRFLEYYTSVYLNQNFYDPTIFAFTKSYWLKDFKRKEFYFDVVSNGIPMRFSGWYGHCLHIIIFASFDNKSEFIDKIDKFFNLPKLNADDVAYHTDANFKDDFFFSYKDSKKGVAVYGYPLLLPDEDKHIARIDGGYNTALELYVNLEENQDEE